jgi:hypothetical protein
MVDYFVSTHAVRVTDDDGEHWVDIKPYLTLADRGRYTDAIMRAGAGADGQGAFEIKLGQVTRTLFECSIVAWNLPDPDTNDVLKVGPHALDRINFEAPLFRKVLEEIRRRNPTLSDLNGSAGSKS